MADSKLLFDIFAVDRASKVFDKVGEHADRMGGHFGRVGKVAGFMGKAVAGAAVFGVAALGGAFAEGLKQAADYQKITAQTTAVIKSTGGSAHVSSAHVEELAKSIEKYSTFSDEAVTKGENLLLTFTNIQNKAGKGNDIFDQSTKALYDMAQALGEDPQKAAIQLGKALNDPVKGITALKRVGVSFSEAQKKVIDNLVKTGHTAEAQKIILAELHKEFGGSAKAAGDTFAGGMTRLKNSLLDTLRDGVTPLLGPLANLAGWLGPKLVAGLQFVVTGVRTFIDGFTNNTDDLIKQGTKWTDPFVNAGFAVRDAFNRMLPTIKQFVGWVKSDLIPAVSHAARQILPALKSAAENVGKGIKDLMPTIRVLGTILTTMLIPIIGQVVTALLKTLGPAFRALAWVMSKVAIPVIKSVLDIWFTMVGALVNGAAKAFGWVPGIGPKLKKAASDFNAFRDKVNNALNGIQDHKTISIIAKANLGFVQMGNSNKSAAGGTGPGRAGGGPVRAGYQYTVGENGREQFVAPADGFIVPNGGTSRGSGGSAGDFTASAPLVIKVDSGVLWQGLVTMKRRRGITSLGLA